MTHHAKLASSLTSNLLTSSDWPAPAKLNLFLYINGQRSDGYHELQTLFQFLNVGDTLKITPSMDSQIIISPAIEGVSLEDNLIYKAAMQLKQAYLKEHSSQSDKDKIQKLGAKIELTKIIPMGGGLGGGSSNAATTLIALNEIWQLGLSIEILANIGLKLGADVPIFVHGFSAFAEGVGEKLTQTTPTEKWYLVIKPNVHIATEKIFQHPKLTRNTPKRPLQQCLSEPYENDCEKIVTLLYPKVAKLLSWLLQYVPSRLTGTGACIFGECETKAQAQALLSQLDKDNVQAFIAKGVNYSPLHETLSKYKQTNSL